MIERTRGRFVQTRTAPPSLLVLLATSALIAIAAGCTATSPRSAAPESREAPAYTGYVTSGYGTIVRDGSGRCVRSGSWQPENAIRECEPEMFARADAAKAKAEAERKAREEAEAARRAKAEADRKAREAAEAAAQKEAKAAAAAARKREPVWRTVGGDAYFPLNEAELNERAKRMLDRLAQRAQDANQVKITVVGHADSTGNPNSNMVLSQRRADAVRTYLEQQGVPGRAIAVDARGENDPVLDCSNRPKAARGECLQVNRRSEIVLSVLEPRGASARAR